MIEYRIVEYSQSQIGEWLSKFLPKGFRPAMREGEPFYLSGRLKSKDEAQKRLLERREQLGRSGRSTKVTVDIEELYS